MTPIQRALFDLGVLKDVRTPDFDPRVPQGIPPDPMIRVPKVLLVFPEGTVVLQNVIMHPDGYITAYDSSETLTPEGLLPWSPQEFLERVVYEVSYRLPNAVVQINTTGGPLHFRRRGKAVVVPESEIQNGWNIANEAEVPTTPKDTQEVVLERTVVSICSLAAVSTHHGQPGNTLVFLRSSGDGPFGLRMRMFNPGMISHSWNLQTSDGRRVEHRKRVAYLEIAANGEGAKVPSQDEEG